MSSLNDFVEDYSVFDLYDKADGEPEVLTLNDNKIEGATPPQLSVRRTGRQRTPTFKVLASQAKKTPTPEVLSSEAKKTHNVEVLLSEAKKTPTVEVLLSEPKKKALSSQGKRTRSAPTSSSKKSSSKKNKSSLEESPESAKSCEIAPWEAVQNNVVSTPKAILEAWVPSSDSVVDRAMANAMESVCATVALRREVDSAREETRKAHAVAENLLDDLRKENEAKSCLQNELVKLTSRFEKAAEYQAIFEKSYELEKENRRVAVERISALEKELAEMQRAQEESDRTISKMRLAQNESDKTISELQADLSYLFGGGLKDLFYKFLKSSEFSARIVSGLGKAFVLAKEALVDPAKKRLIPGCFEDVRSGHYAFFDHLHPGMSVDDLKSWGLDAAQNKA